MTTIEIEYHLESKTFTAEDGYGNNITFKSDRESSDLAPNSTGKSLGPMISLLMSCGACSGIDIVMILEKQRQTFTKLSIKVIGEREKDKTPALWETVKVEYYLEGDFNVTKADHAAKLSVDKYCSAIETVRRAGAKVSYNVFVNQK